MRRNALVHSLHLGWPFRFPSLLCSIFWMCALATTEHYWVYATEPDHTFESMLVATLHVCGLSLGQVARASHLSRVALWLENLDKQLTTRNPA